MSASIADQRIADQPIASRPVPPSADPPEPDLPQWSRRQIAALWAAVTIPMSVLGWVVAPWLGHHFIGRDPFIDALVLCFNIGLIWQVVLVFAVVRREQGSLAWPKVRDALWLRAPQSPRTGRRGGRVWWWVGLFLVGTAVANALPIDPIGPFPRDFPKAITSDRIAHYFDGNWIAFAMITINALLAPIAEELVWRGLMLPRSRAAFGGRDFLASGTLFTLYHLHQPWCMPTTWVDGVINQAYASRRFRSTWMGLITHTAPSFLVIPVVLALVV